MKYVRARTALALLIAVPLYIILATGCATPRGVPDYDGDLIPQSATVPDSVRVTILNERTIDAQPPRIYLDGMGRHDLGIISSIDGRISRLVSTSWFGPSGCFTIVAHFVGRGDLRFSEVCWRPGEVVSATLLNHFDPRTAWSHR